MKKQNLWISFLPAWIIANIIGWFIFTAILLFPIGQLLLPLSGGFILGVLQWIVLQKFLGVDWRWAAAGIPIYAGVNYILYSTTSPISLAFLNALILGLLGWLQYAVLNEYMNGAKAWMFISAFAGFFGSVFAYYLGAGSLARFWLTYGIVYGIVTGILLMALMTKSISVSKENQEGGANEKKDKFPI